MQPNEVIYCGRIYDLTALETPYGLLPEPVQQALEAWPFGLEMMTYSGQMLRTKNPYPRDKAGAVWRAVPGSRVIMVYCDPQTETTAKLSIQYEGDQLPRGVYTGPGGATFTVETVS